MNPLITNEALPNNIMMLQMKGKLSIHYQLFLIDFVNSEVTTVVGKNTDPSHKVYQTKPRIYQYQT